MTPDEIARLQAHLRTLFGNKLIEVALPARRGGSVELKLDGEFIGTVHRDAEDGDVSYAVTIAVLEEDLPPPAKK
jgi:hypothetical protein